jgi:PIN domain nuclease of toxin-antitoxin system
MAPPVPRRLLLDTHVWLWWQTADRRLGPGATRMIRQCDDVRFSAASAWEIAIKVALGKLVMPRGASIGEQLALDGFSELPVTVAHAEGVRRLPALHSDPFDRLLISQALHEGLVLLTADGQLGQYNVSIIDARN